MTVGNDLAYPFKFSVLEGAGKYDVEARGLTKREYFTAMAMQGLYSSTVMNKTDDKTLAADAELFVRVADAIIDALNKQSK